MKQAPPEKLAKPVSIVTTQQFFAKPVSFVTTQQFLLH